MSLATFLRRIGRTSGDERRILAEAVMALGTAALAIRLTPFKRLARKVGSPGRAPTGGTEGAARAIEQARWAIKAAGPYLPWKVACFQEGLALHSMLRRRGVASYLHYGVGQSPERGLSAHVWVTVDHRIVIGKEEAAGHACLATFPASADCP